NDKTGVIFFSDKIEKFIPPKKGKSHILRIIRELIDFKPDNLGTNIPEALRYFTNVIKKKCTAFVISDFMDQHADLERALSVANNKHDVVAVRIFDERETELPSIGMLKVKDAETGNYVWVNSSDPLTRTRYKAWWLEQSDRLKGIFTRCGVDAAMINTNEDYVRALMNLFKKREARS
ncbi:MAG TPA: VWA domain-containing protein, partial [Prolixibacteraceae bacterium]|nr:VWA domain-containing protein [Prolixibacteraceae bacterium]